MQLGRLEVMEQSQVDYVSKISKIQEKNKTRHYQSISSFEIRQRNISNLKYIKNYFEGYITWLDEIKKIN